MARDRHGPDEAVRITTASASRQDDIAGRQRRYLLSMGIRTMCFIGAILAAVAGLNWLWPILIVAALILPYVAVVMANAANTRGDGFALLDESTDHKQLEGGQQDGKVAPESGSDQG